MKVNAHNTEGSIKSNEYPTKERPLVQRVRLNYLARSSAGKQVQRTQIMGAHVKIVTPYWPIGEM